jgi:hypothetical protein
LVAILFRAPALRRAQGRDAAARPALAGAKGPCPRTHTGAVAKKGLSMFERLKWRLPRFLKILVSRWKARAVLFFSVEMWSRPKGMNCAFFRGRQGSVAHLTPCPTDLRFPPLHKMERGTKGERSFQQQHFLRFGEITNLQLVEINTRCYLISGVILPIPHDQFVT